jgi:hypothetical protein
MCSASTPFKNSGSPRPIRSPRAIGKRSLSAQSRSPRGGQKKSPFINPESGSEWGRGERQRRGVAKRENRADEKGKRVLAAEPPQRNMLDNAVTWIAKIAQWYGVPHNWIVSREALYSTSGDDVVADQSANLQQDEIMEQVAMSSDHRAWVPITDILSTGISVEDFYAIATSPKIASAYDFTPVDIVMLYYATTNPSTEGYRAPASMRMRESQVNMEEANRVWLLNEDMGRLDEQYMRVNFENWKNKAMNDFNREKAEMDDIVKRQRQLLALEPYEASPFIEDESTVHIPFSIDEPNPNIQTVVDGLDLLRRARVSRDIPLLKWIPGTEQALKVPFRTQGRKGGQVSSEQLIHMEAPRGEDVEITKERPMKVAKEMIELDADGFNAALQLANLNIAEETERERGGSVMLLSVYSGRPPSLVSEGQYTVKSRFEVAALKIKPGSFPLSGAITFKAHHDVLDDILDRIEEAFNVNGGARFVLDREGSRLTRISGDVEIEEAGNFDERALIMNVMLDPLLHSYFYIGEESYLQTDKKRIVLQFRGQGRIFTSARAFTPR